MKLHRIYAILLRHMYTFRRSYDRLTDAFYWPLIDLLVWGITSSYLRSYAPANANIIAVIVTGIIFWLIVYRAQYEITVNTLSELWDRNLINLFVSPLTLPEFMTSFLIIGILKSVMSVIFTGIMAFFLYKFQVFSYGLYLIPFSIILIMTGWWIGFIVMSLILRYGTRIQTLAWTMVAIISPFSAIYYPLSFLPAWAQKVSYFVPTTYVFESARELLHTGHTNLSHLYVSFALNCIYLILAALFLRTSFRKVLEKGLVKVY